jgi:hypothetical protein
VVASVFALYFGSADFLLALYFVSADFLLADFLIADQAPIQTYLDNMNSLAAEVHQRVAGHTNVSGL